MKRIMFNGEGIATLRHFATELQCIYNEYVDAGNSLIQEMDLYRDSIGYDAESIEVILQTLQEQLKMEINVFSDMHDYCLKIAEKMENALSAKMRPESMYPRDLTISQYGMEQDQEGNYIYDSPMQMDHFMYKKQGSAYKNFQGTCGLCSCANILRLAGVNATEREMIDYASKTFSEQSFDGRLCTCNRLNPGENGGTSPRDRQCILEHFGIQSSIFQIEENVDGTVADINIERMADWVSKGHGIILSVHADMLWYNQDYPTRNDSHAITVTSVKKSQSGKILGFYVCDSANGGTSFYEAEKIKNSLTHAPMNVTQAIIR